MGKLGAALAGVDEENMSEPKVRRAYGAGRWFPGRKAELSDMIASYLDAAAVPDSASLAQRRTFSVVAPHAGYVYSGKVAAHAFRALRDQTARPETVVIIGFVHSGRPFRGMALMDGDAVGGCGIGVCRGFLDLM